MTGKYLSIYLLLSLLHAVALMAQPIENIWPFWSEWETSAGTTKQWQAAGPIFFGKQHVNGQTISGIRPFFVDMQDSVQNERQVYGIYPLFGYREDRLSQEWNILRLVRSYHFKGESHQSRDLDLFPIYWSREDETDPSRSYLGIFPLVGTIKNRMFADRIDWWMFPLVSRYENKGEVVYSHPWPFFRTQSGAGSGGYSIWPLFSHRHKEGVYDRKYAFWPIYYHNQEHLDQPIPTVSFGVLPFYSSRTAPNERSEHYPWPFVGYVERDNPAYLEQHYLWPLWLTGKGEQREEQRWLPFYSYGRDKVGDMRVKRWYMWPLIRLENYQQAGLQIEKEQLLFFLFWNMRQSRMGDPNSPIARKTHIWPFSSSWDNGAGRQQFQFLSPFEVFFPDNTPVRELYTPLFSLYRKDIDEQTGRYRHDFLFNLITWQEDAENQRFDIGPVIQQKSGEGGFSFKILYGLLGWSQDANESHLHFFWFRL